MQLRDEELTKESQEANWFSAPSSLRVYGEKYLTTLLSVRVQAGESASILNVHVYNIHVCRITCMMCSASLSLSLSPRVASGQYLSLDADHNGMLSRDEIAR